MKVSFKSLASACTAAYDANPQLHYGKHMSVQINPFFQEGTAVIVAAAVDGNAIALTELARRSVKHGMTVEAYLRSKIKAPKTDEKKQTKGTPIAAAAPVVQPKQKVVSLQSMQAEVERLMGLIKSMAQQTNEQTPAPSAPAPKPADSTLKNNCIKAAMAAISAEDRSALKAELINLGLIDGSSKMRFDKMVALFNENFQVKVSKHKAPASTPKVIGSANLSIGNIQFAD
jgi:hypothetical protein